MPATPFPDAFGGFAGPAPRTFYAATLSAEIVLYAVFLVSFAYAMWMLLSKVQQKSSRWGLNIGLIVCNTLMLLLATAHLALDARGAVHGFSGGSQLFDAIKFIIYVLETLIGSGFMIYRLYRVYSRRWQVIVVPSILLVADGVCILVRVLRISRHSEANHVLVRRSTQTQVWRVVEALVQSTAITCAASMSLVVTFLNNASLGYPTCLNIFPALIALVFSLTVLRIALNAKSADGLGRGADSSQSHTGVASDQRTMVATVSTSPSCGTLPEALRRQYAGTPARIHISTTTIVQHDFPKPPGLAGDFVLPLQAGY